MTETLRIIGVGATVASLLIHLSTYLPGLEVSMRQVFYMHFVVIILFFSMFLSAGKFIKSGKDSYDLQSRVGTFRLMLKAIPTPVLIMIGLSFAYAVINFAVFIVLMEGGSPSASDGVYYLHSHGQKIRDLTLTEYKRFLVYEVRGFSGYWIIFSLIPTVFYFCREGILNAIRGNKSIRTYSSQEHD